MKVESKRGFEWSGIKSPTFPTSNASEHGKVIPKRKEEGGKHVSRVG